jgi:hypothetical protein
MSLRASGHIACYGGSDWPVVNLAGGYEKWFAAAETMLAGLSFDETRLSLAVTRRASISRAGEQLRLGYERGHHERRNQILSHFDRRRCARRSQVAAAQHALAGSRTGRGLEPGRAAEMDQGHLPLLGGRV